MQQVSNTSYFVTDKDKRTLEFFQKGAKKVTMPLGENTSILCMNSSGIVAGLVDGSLKIGSIKEGFFLTIDQNVHGLASAVFVGEGTAITLVVSILDHIVRFPFAHAVTFDEGMPVRSKRLGTCTLLSMHDNTTCVYVSEQGIVASHEPYLFSSKGLDTERLQVIENVAEPAQVTHERKVAAALGNESARWKRSTQPMFAGQSQGIYGFVQRSRTFVLSMFIVPKLSIYAANDEQVFKMRPLLATRECVLAATVHAECVYVATPSGLWTIPLREITYGLAVKEDKFRSFDTKKGWGPDVSTAVFIENKLYCSGGRSWDL